MRGRPPKATHLHVVEGTLNVTRHKRRIEREPRPEGDLIDPPADLPPAQAEEWRYVMRHAPKGVLKMIDHAVLRIYVAAYVSHHQANELLAGLGGKGLLAANGKGQLVPSPLLKVRNQQAVIMRMAIVELGFTPVARVRLVGDKPNPADPAEEFFGG